MPNRFFDDLFNNKGRFEEEPGIPVARTKNQAIFQPHWTDPRSKKEQTAYGKEEKGLSYDYSDRLWEWDYNKAKEASQVANDSKKTRNSCAYYEIYLSHYFGKEIEIKHILVGCNIATGYNYIVFGYKEKR